jgi:hypothetical protein
MNFTYFSTVRVLAGLLRGGGYSLEQLGELEKVIVHVLGVLMTGLYLDWEHEKVSSGVPIYWFCSLEFVFKCRRVLWLIGGGYSVEVRAHNRPQRHICASNVRLSPYTC